MERVHINTVTKSANQLLVYLCRSLHFPRKTAYVTFVRLTLELAASTLNPHKNRAARLTFSGFFHHTNITLLKLNVDIAQDVKFH